MTTNLILPNQRVSLSTKRTTKWTRQMADYVVALAHSCNDKTETIENLRMANGYVSKSTYEYVLKTYGLKTENKVDRQERILEDLRNIDFLQPIKDKYLGEFVTSYNNFQVYSDDPDTIFLRNKDFGKKVLAVMEQQLINKLNEKMDTGQESKEVPDIKAMFEDFIETWNNERTSAAQQRLNLLNNLIEAKLKYNQLYYYWWACEECYTYRTVHKNNVIFEVVPPTEYYRIPGDGYYVEDDDYGVRIFRRSLYNILDMYSEYLTDDDIKYLKAFHAEDVPVDARVEMLRSRIIDNGVNIAEFGEDNLNNLATNNVVFNNPDSIPMVHYVFTTEVKVGYLTYVNEHGEVSQDIVDEDYKLDVTAGDISIEWDWVTQKYQGEILGYGGTNSSVDAVYTKVRPIDVQRELFGNINVTKSPYNGLSYIHRDSERKPIPARINPYLALSRIYHYQIERAINRWKSIITIPQSILTDDENMTVEQRLAKMNGDSLLVFNDAEVNANALQAIKEVATTATYNFINTIQSLLVALKQEAWEVVNMTNTRMGNQAPYQGKSVSEDSLAQSQISSSWSLEMFNMFRERDYLANYDISKIAWAEGKSGSYTDESTNQSVYVDVDPSEHFSTNIGINVGNSKLLDEKLRAMKQLAFSAAQNGDVVVGTEAIMNDNLQSLRDKILAADKANKAYEQQMADAKNQAMLQAAQIAKETEQIKLQGELQKIQLENDGRENEKYIEQETALLTWEKRLQVDKNANGYIDMQEANEGQLLNVQIAKENLALKREKLALDRHKTLNQPKAASKSAK